MRTNRTPPARSIRNITLFTLIALAIALLALSTARAAQAPIGLGTADSFAVLAGSKITNTGPTTIRGDVGLHPGSSVTGFASVTLQGELHVADAVAGQAKTDLVTAYNDAAGRGPATTVATELGGQVLKAGVYDSASGTFGITGALTLDAEGDPKAVFIFQTESTLITATVSRVALINGADACNVYWQVGSSATLGTGTTFKGTILALAAITIQTGATVDGRSLARNEAVTLDTNTIQRGACSAATTPTPTPTPPLIPIPTLVPTATPTSSPPSTPTPTPTGAPTSPPPSTPTPTPTAAPTSPPPPALIPGLIPILPVAPSATPTPTSSPTQTAKPVPPADTSTTPDSSPTAAPSSPPRATPSRSVFAAGPNPAPSQAAEVALGEQTLPRSGAPITVLVFVALALIASGLLLRRWTPAPRD